MGQPIHGLLIKSHGSGTVSEFVRDLSLTIVLEHDLLHRKFIEITVQNGGKANWGLIVVIHVSPCSKIRMPKAWKLKQPNEHPRV